MISFKAAQFRFFKVNEILTLLFTLFCSIGHIYGITGSSTSSQNRELRTRNSQESQPQDQQISPIHTLVKAKDPFVADADESDHYELDVDGLLLTARPTKQPSVQPSNPPYGALTSSPSNSPTRDSPTDSISPTLPPSKSSIDFPTDTSSELAVDTSRGQPDELPTIPSRLKPTCSPAASCYRIMEEVVALALEQEGDFLPEEDTDEASQREPYTPHDNTVAGGQGSVAVGGPQPTRQINADPADANLFLPDLEPDYYYIDLRPFSVFVNADRDLSTDLGIPLYLLLEMGESLATLVDIKITNLTIHMGVQTHQHKMIRHRRAQEHVPNHYHWNQLFFHGLAQFDDRAVYPTLTVQNVQSLVLSQEAALQQFWDDEGRSEMYKNLKLQNITLLPLPRPPKPETEWLTQQVGSSTQPLQPTQAPHVSNATVETENSKRDSNIWVMVPLFLIFLLIGFCIICLAGRLQYLSSRAQDKYSEKYGLDYNIYDKDIGKEIFKEEYLMSEHNEDQDFSQSHLSDSLRSIEFVTKSSRTATKRSSRHGKKPVPAHERHSTEEEEEEMRGSYPAEMLPRVLSAEDGIYTCSSHSRPLASAGSEGRKSVTSDIDGGGFSNEQAFPHKVVVVPCIIIARSYNEADRSISERGRNDDLESEPPDEEIAFIPKESSGVANHDGDALPLLIKFAGPSKMATSDTVASDGVSHMDKQNRDLAILAPKDRSGMGNWSSREKSYGKSRGSFDAGDDRAMGNSSRGSRGDRSSPFNRSMGPFGSGNVGEEVNVMVSSGRGDRSTRSNRSIPSNHSESSIGSFYSCQGDLV